MKLSLRLFKAACEEIYKNKTISFYVREEEELEQSIEREQRSQTTRKWRVQ